MRPSLIEIRSVTYEIRRRKKKKKKKERRNHSGKTQALRHHDAVPCGLIKDVCKSQDRQRATYNVGIVTVLSTQLNNSIFSCVLLSIQWDVTGLTVERSAAGSRFHVDGPQTGETRSYRRTMYSPEDWSLRTINSIVMNIISCWCCICCI